MPDTRPVEYGGGTLTSPKLLLRQVLWDGIHLLVGDPARMTELFGRSEHGPQSTAAQWQADMREALTLLLDRDNIRPLRILDGYPLDEAVLPAISLVIESGSEDDGEAVAGDILDELHERRGTDDYTAPEDGRTIRALVRGGTWRSVVQIGSWSVVPEVSSLMHEVIKHVLIGEKGELARAGVNEVSLSESGLQPDPREYPRVGLVPFVRCTMAWTLRQTRRRGPVPTGYTLRPVRVIS